MTRKEELKKKVDEIFQCESFGYDVSREDVVSLLLHLEREVWERVQRRYHCHEYMSDHRTFGEWLTAQQQELGS